jgi:ankyrin repeat protein
MVFHFVVFCVFFVPGDTELLEHLLSKGINPDLESDAGTPLVWAAGHAQEAAVTVLLKHGANVIPHSILLFCVTFV